MKIPVGTTGIEVEVGQYREIDKGALRGFFTLIEYPYGRKTIDNRHFVQGKNEWFAFPQKEYTKTGETKTEYFPLVSYLDKKYFDEYKEAVIKAIKLYKEANAKTHAPQEQKNPLPDDASALWF